MSAQLSPEIQGVLSKEGAMAAEMERLSHDESATEADLREALKDCALHQVALVQMLRTANLTITNLTDALYRL